MRFKLTALFFALVLAANAQAVGDKPADSRVFNLDMGPAPGTASVDPKLHADVLQLVEVSGVRQELEQKKRSLVEEGRKKIVEKCPKCAPEFSREWAKRMLERMKMEDFVDVYVHGYEKYLNREDVTELISLKMKSKAHEPAVATPRLQEKLRAVMPGLMGDVMGGCAKIGAELGGRVGEEIEKEHPEYFKNASLR